MSHRRHSPTPLAALTILSLAATAFASGGADHSAEFARASRDAVFGLSSASWLELQDVADEQAPGLRWDQTTGADTRHYAPSRLVDFKNMKLEIDIPDMNTPRFDAVETLDIAPIGDTVDSLRLNAEQLDIHSVEATKKNQSISWSHDGSILQLTFDPPLKPGVTSAVRIEYTCDDPPQGLSWAPHSDAWPDRPAQLHTQGEPETNRFWFVAHDSPNDRLTTELVVTVPKGFVASSNGKLVSKKTRRGRTTFDWRQDTDHVSYLVTLVVGKFDIVDVGRGKLDMPVYAPLGKGQLVKKTFGRTLDMIRVFEDRFGVDYPWDQYAQLIVWNFAAGGMENTSATTLYDTAILDDKAFADGDLDGLISHELGHQWFGDLLTCNSWAHIWLNEGFATYANALWMEARDGYDAGYLVNIDRSARGVASFDQIKPDDDKGWRRPPMVSRMYEHPWDVFRRRSNPYPKGASILHMLRTKLGDDLFFKGLRLYTQRNQHQTVETVDFRRAMEEVSGRSLDRFFQQWAYRPGTPILSIDADWSDADSELHLVVNQTQRIDDNTPAYSFDLPVLIATGEGEQTVTLSVNGRTSERRITLSEEPTMVVVDPETTVLKTMTVHQSASRFIEQLTHGPTVISRMAAARALVDHAGKKTTEALTAAVHNSSEAFTVRQTAADALGDLEETEPLVSIARAGVDDARVRRAIMQALTTAAGPGALDVLTQYASNTDESYATRAAALRGVGKLGDREQLPVLLAALDSDSQHEQVRSAALRGLAELGEEEGLRAAVPFTKPGWLERLRPAAINTVAELAEFDPDLAYDTIFPLLHDREPRARSAAGAALVDLADDRAIPELRRLARTDRDATFRKQASDWADKLAAAASSDDSELEIRAQLKKLRREMDELKQASEDRK